MLIRPYELTLFTNFLLLFLHSVPWAGSEAGVYTGADFGHVALEEAFGSRPFDDGDSNGRKDFVGFNFGLVPFIDVAFEGGFVDFADPHMGVTDGSIDL